MTTTGPHDDTACRVLGLAAGLAEAQSRLRELGDPATLRAQVTGLKRQLATITASEEEPRRN